MSMIQSAYDSIIAQVDDSLKSLLDNEATSHVQKKIILCGKLLSSCLGNQLKFEDIKFEDQNNSVSSSIDKVETSIDDNCDAFSFNRVTFDDIIGCDDAKQSIFENIILPFRMPREKQIQIYSGIRQQQANILLYGPPGVGKTILVEAAAHEANATLFTMRPSEILSMYQGESEKHLRQVFEKAQAKQRAIIFFDEFDSIAASRGGVGEGGAQARRLLSELLILLSNQKTKGKGAAKLTDTAPDSICTKKQKVESTSDSNDSLGCGLVIMAATNRIDDLDEAILRRFESKIYVGVPDREDRTQLIKHFLAHPDVEHSLSEAHTEQLADICFGWSGSDIEALCRLAAMMPLRDAVPMTQCVSAEGAVTETGTQKFSVPVVTDSMLQLRAITMEDFEKALGVLSKNSYCDVRNVALVSGDGSVGSEMVN